MDCVSYVKNVVLFLRENEMDVGKKIEDASKNYDFVREAAVLQTAIGIIFKIFMNNNIIMLS